MLGLYKCLVCKKYFDKPLMRRMGYYKKRRSFCPNCDDELILGVEFNLKDVLMLGWQAVKLLVRGKVFANKEVGEQENI